MLRGRRTVMMGTVNTTTTGGYLQSALIGGAVMGLLSALPVISAGNVCCCLWVVAGGLTSAYFLQQNRPTPVSPVDGALVGLLAGVMGAGIQFVLSIPIGLIVGPIEREMVARFIEMSGNMPESTREALERYADGSSAGFAGMLVLRVIGLFITLVVSAVVSTVAGLVGAVVFARGTLPAPPPAPPDGSQPRITPPPPPVPPPPLPPA